MSAVLSLSKLVIKEAFRKKDFYVALLLMGVVLCYAAQLKCYSVGHIVRYLMEIGLALVYLFSVILTVSLAARQYPSEVHNRTGQVLFAKPVHRAEFVVGKFFGCFLSGAMCFAIFYALFLGVVSFRSTSFSAILATQSFYLFLLNLMVVAAMASALSYFVTISANVSLSIVIYLVISLYGAGLKQASSRLYWLSRILGEAFYYFMPHFEFFDLRQRFIHHWDPIPWSLAAFLTLYAVAYSAVFLILGWLKLRRECL